MMTVFLPKVLQINQSLKTLYTALKMLSAMDIFLLTELQLLFFHFLWEPLQLI